MYPRLTRFDREAEAVWIKWAHPDRVTFFAVADAIKARIPAYARTYDPRAKAWCIETYWLHELYDVLPELRDHLNGRARTRRAEPPPCALQVPPEVAEAFVALHLLPTAPRQVVQAAYRALAQLHHPDAGGNHQAMVAVNAAYEVAREWSTPQGAAPAPGRASRSRRRRGAPAA
jgi:hypothetical protein